MNQVLFPEIIWDICLMFYIVEAVYFFSENLFLALRDFWANFNEKKCHFNKSISGYCATNLMCLNLSQLQIKEVYKSNNPYRKISVKYSIFVISITDRREAK